MNILKFIPINMFKRNFNNNTKVDTINKEIRTYNHNDDYKDIDSLVIKIIEYIQTHPEEWKHTIGPSFINHKADIIIIIIIIIKIIIIIIRITCRDNIFSVAVGYKTSNVTILPKNLVDN
jgi:hypothetical protein